MSEMKCSAMRTMHVPMPRTPGDSSLYAEDSREPSGKFVFKFQNKPRKGKKNRLSSLRLHITHETAYLNNFTFELRIRTALLNYTFELHIGTALLIDTFDL